VFPLLVFVSLWTPTPLDLLFNRLELVALVIAVFITRNMTIDGESDWLEGAMLVSVYLTLGIGFYFIK
jgi:Ca2+:H+ antiporter